MSGAQSEDGESDAYALDAGWLRRSFDRAGATYDGAAVLQSEVRDVLLGRLDLTALAPHVVLDAGIGYRPWEPGAEAPLPQGPGAGRGFGARNAPRRRRTQLLAAPRRAHLRARRTAAARRRQRRSRVLQLVLPWCRPDAVFSECRRVLAPHGLFCFTSLGPDTLFELRAAWAEVDANSRVHRFIDMHDLGDALVRAGFAAPVLDVERYTVHYADMDAFAGDLKALGMRNAAAGRLKGLTTPRKFAAMRRSYERLRRDGRLPATYEVVFGHAWAPAAAAGTDESARAARGERSISLEAVKRQLRGRREP